MKKFRLIQLLIGVHYIHHVHYSYGFKLPFLEIAYFKNFGWKQTVHPKLKGKKGKDIKKPYHNCSWSGVY